MTNTERTIYEVKIAGAIDYVRIYVEADNFSEAAEIALAADRENLPEATSRVYSVTRFGVIGDNLRLKV